MAMDDLNIHMAAYPRYFPHPAAIQNIGFVRQKTGWLRSIFGSFNFSFILSGSGTYRTATREWPVVAPCVITQWPGLYVEYGPTPDWEELYLIYPAERQAYFEACGYARPAKPVWYLHDPVPLRRKQAKLRELVKEAARFGVADRIDRLCDEMVLESWLGEAAEPTDRKSGAIGVLRQYLEENCTEDVDFDHLAAEAGFSRASFRRHWARQVGTPPGQYMAARRMQEACRLLAETDWSIKEVARRLGFNDPLYFSRRFRQVIGMPASEYRHRHPNPLIPRDKQS